MADHLREAMERDSGYDEICSDRLYAYGAVWLHSKVIGFHDAGNEIVEEILSWIERYLPPNVLEWGFDDDESWWFRLANMTLELQTSHDRSTFFEPLLTRHTDTTNSLVMQMIKDELSALVEHHGPSMTSFRDVAVLVLQMIEMVAMGSVYLKNEELGWQWNDNPFEVHEAILDVTRPASPIICDDAEIESSDLNIFNLSSSDILAMIPKDYTVLSIESIRREDFTASWLEYQKELRRRASRDTAAALRNKLHPHIPFRPPGRAEDLKNELVNHTVKPLVTFHGSSRANVASIIEHGFLMPGTVLNGNTIKSPRSGSVILRGIYSSQSADYALSYSRCHGAAPTTRKELPGLLLLVATTLMGRTYRGRDVHGQLQANHDAHFDGGFEYIVHDTRAMLPCFVIRLDLDEPNAVKRIERVQMNPRLAAFYPLQNYKTPGDLQREQIAKKMAALKWFPYGYGPATGVQFKVEAIAPIDDDEEPHGYEYRDWMTKYHGENYGRVLTWMDVIEQDQGLLVEMFKQPD